MFSDSEKEDEEELAPPGKDSVEKKGGKRVAEIGEARRKRGRVERAGGVWHRSARGGVKAVANARKATVGSQEDERPGASLVEKIAKSYVDPRINARSHVEVVDRPRRSSPDASARDYWTRKSILETRRRAEALRANPAGLDGRAAYERPSMHGKALVISVGPSSLPSGCRVTKSRIPAADVSWD